MSVLDESKLHTRLGVRRPDIAAIRTCPIAAVLHIRRDDERIVVLAKLLWHVDHTIGRVTSDPVLQEALRYCFNLPRDAELNPLMQGERLALLQKRKQGAPGWKQQTINKKIAGYGEQIYHHWRDGKNPCAPDDEIERIVLAEKKYEQSRLGDAESKIPPALFQHMLRDLTSAQAVAVESALPQQALFFEVSDTGHVVTIKTQEHEQLPVFTSEEQFAAFAPGGRCEMAKGIELLDLLANYPEVGLSVNPIVGDATAYHWTASEMPRFQQVARAGEV